MDLYKQFSGNPLCTREDLHRALDGICSAVRPYYSKGGARLRLGSSCAHYPSGIAEMEGFSRLLWGLVPLWFGGSGSVLDEICLDGIRHGTDPANEEYWGGIGDCDQRMVEMAALGFALALTPEKVWKPLSQTEKRNLAVWLNQINHFKIYDCNWLLFNVLVNMGLKNVAMPYDSEKMTACLDRVLEFYLSDGWYSDGPGAHCDYYTAFAIHFYTLIYAKVMGKEDPIRASMIRSRAEVFAKQFVFWFSQDGSALPYGRSLTYRFAQSAFWSALVFAGVEPFPMGTLKGIILRNLRWWFQNPIFSGDGILKIGYAYENQFMSESYNSPGSPYWALKAFLPLALGADHPFWRAEELPLPSLESVHVQPGPHFVICRQPEKSNVLAFTGGYTYHDGHTNTVPKYEKFVYSTGFGFSVPRGPYGLSQGAYDSTLALSDDGDLFRVKTHSERCAIHDGKVYMLWHLWDNVEVKTCVIPGPLWHVRIHRIRTERSLQAADGGFSFPVEDGGVRCDSFECEREENGLLVSGRGKACGAVCLYGGGTADLVYAEPNTNLLCPRTVIPTVKWTTEPGDGLFVTAVFGETEYESRRNWLRRPSAELRGGRLRILSAEKVLFDMNLNEWEELF